jgi:hypothetical protein
MLSDMATCVMFIVMRLFIVLTNVKDNCISGLMELLLTLVDMD